MRPREVIILPAIASSASHDDTSTLNPP
jgi:hypothetical protein